MKREAKSAAEKISKLQNYKDTNNKSKIKRLESTISCLEKSNQEYERDIDNLTQDNLSLQLELDSSN